MTKHESKIGAAILGLYAAIKICSDEGYDVHEVLRMVHKQVLEWDLIPKQNGITK